MLSRTVYRSRQVAQALFPGLRDSHISRARELLSGGEMALFLGMARHDQRHGLRVMEHLEREGQTDPDLLAAALLHDCGKGEVPLWLRIAYVVHARYVEGLAATQGGEASCSAPDGWRPSFSRLIAGLRLPGHDNRSRAAAYRLVHHVRLGTEAAAAAGASAATVRFIAGRAGEHEHAKIALLRAADDRS